MGNHVSEFQSQQRVIRVFISSTFRDMMGERDELMSHTWPALRRLCQECHVELVEVDLRWGIAEEQSTRKETLKLCLDEIRSCRPFFIGLLGERYGWVPDDDAFTADLREEQSWLNDLLGKSVTELEILHGVLRNPDMAGRAFFYFRDPSYARSHGTDYLSEDADSTAKQTALKTLIKKTCAANEIPLHEDYSDPDQLAALVLADLTAAIEAEFPREDIPDSLAREAQGHEAFAESRRRTYIGRDAYFAALDRHAAAEDGPLVLLGDSGSGKSALLANWLAQWRKDHPRDLIVQHYIGGTTDSAEHWRLMTRLMAEIKRWSDDPEPLPAKHEDILRDFPLWLAKARAKAGHDKVRCILVLDALNQLDGRDHARLLGWLPEHPFSGPLRLIVSSLPGKPGADDPLAVLEQRAWQQLRIEPLTVDERRRMIGDYLSRFGKRLDAHRVDCLATAAPAANPLYLKILLDDLRVTGTHERLDERLGEYLAAPDIPALLGQVLARYRRDYERDRPNLVAEALGFIHAARRGLTETELLGLLKPSDQPQLPLAIWSPLRAALEDSLIDRGGILNFAHDFLRTAVGTAFVPDAAQRQTLQGQLADFFEALPVTARSCDELPWLLRETNSRDRLRTCLLDIDRFLLIRERDEEELRGYWIEPLHEQQSMGKAYLRTFEPWSQELGRQESRIAYAANQLAFFLFGAALYTDAEPLMRRALAIDEVSYGPQHPTVAIRLNNLALLLQDTNRLGEAEPLMRRALAINEASYEPEHPDVATGLNNLAQLLQNANRLGEAEPLMRRALAINEASYGPEHPKVARDLNNLASLLQATNRLGEAEPLMRRALDIYEAGYGPEHPEVATGLNNLAVLLYATNRMGEAEPLMRRALEINETGYGPEHPKVARDLNNLAQLLLATNRLGEAEPLMRRALAIDETSYGPEHPKVAISLSRLAQLLQDTNRMGEAEPLMRRALEIVETSYGPERPNVATGLTNLAQLLQATNRLDEAEPLMRRALEIDETSYGPEHPEVARDLNNLAQLLLATNRLGEAEPLMRRALEIDEASYGPENPSVARDLTNLAQLLKDTNRLGEAEPLMRRALEIDEASYGPEHPSVARDLSNLAQLLQDTNRMGEAEPLMRRALEIDETSYGPEHPNVAIGLNNLAQLLQATNRLGDAEPLMRRALAIDEVSYGPQHPTVAIRLNNLAGLLQATNRLGEAEPLMRRALEIDETNYGPEHPNVATVLNTLAALLQATNRLKEAEPFMRRALEIYEASYGLDHPNVATALNNLAQLLKATNRLGEAEPLMRRMVEIFLNFTRETGHPHPHLNDAIGNYVGLLQARGKSGEDIKSTLTELGSRYGVDLGAAGESAGNHISPKLRPVLEEMRRDQSKMTEIADRLQRDDPELFKELIAFIQSQQKNTPS